LRVSFAVEKIQRGGVYLIRRRKREINDKRSEKKGLLVIEPPMLLNGTLRQG